MKFNGFVMSGWAVKRNSRMSGCDMLMAGHSMYIFLYNIIYCIHIIYIYIYM